MLKGIADDSGAAVPDEDDGGVSRAGGQAGSRRVCDGLLAGRLAVDGLGHVWGHDFEASRC